MNDKLNIKKFESVNNINSYLAMFPLKVPLKFIEEYSNKNDLVMDNFSGRGTTLTACRMLERNFIGNDLSPYAFVISRFKTIKNITKKEIFDYIDKLEIEYVKEFKNKEISLDNEMLLFYDPKTLKELLFLREKIGKNWQNNSDIENAVLTFLLSILQGKERKDGTSAYLSVSMPNTISLSPNYVSNYVKKHNLEIKYRNCFSTLKQRIEQKWDELLENTDLNLRIEYANSLSDLSFIKDESVQLVFTSPPYLNVIDYTLPNWIRLWLLGFERKELKTQIKLDDRHNFDNYCIFIKKYLENIYQKMAKNGIAILVIGDVKELNLAKATWEKIANEVSYKKIKISSDIIDDSKKVLKIMKNKPISTKKDRFLILRKI